ncbi:acyl-[acyl-carrier-protein] thioesterase [Flavobacterium sp. JP2137]|uniref:acyl-[acyl-carrier-protein] thioesterase n=1 Tax=Flavobacterium sp. JP2137 TaxID=3414510 RepID=UPI003D2FE5C5
MPISPNFTSLYSQTHEVDFLECAPSGKLKTAAIGQILQKVANTHSILGGISLEDLQRTQIAWVLNKMKIEIVKLPQWQDVIEIQTWIQSLEGSRSIRDFEVFLNGEKIMGISTFWVIIDTEKRRPGTITIPLDHFTIFESKKALKKGFSKFPLHLPFEKISENSVRYSDLDMVNHVNNTKYVEWVLDAVPFDKIMHQDFKEIEMVFKREMVYGMPYEVNHHADQADRDTYSISHGSSTYFICHLSWKPRGEKAQQ